MFGPWRVAVCSMRQVVAGVKQKKKNSWGQNSSKGERETYELTFMDLPIKITWRAIGVKVPGFKCPDSQAYS